MDEWTVLDSEEWRMPNCPRHYTLHSKSKSTLQSEYRFGILNYRLSQNWEQKNLLKKFVNRQSSVVTSFNFVFVSCGRVDSENFSAGERMDCGDYGVRLTG